MFVYLLERNYCKYCVIFCRKIYATLCYFPCKYMQSCLFHVLDRLHVVLFSKNIRIYAILCKFNKCCAICYDNMLRSYAILYTKISQNFIIYAVVRNMLKLDAVFFLKNLGYMLFYFLYANVPKLLFILRRNMPTH